MDINFQFVLMFITISFALIVLIDVLYWAPKRLENKVTKRPFVIDNARSLLPVLVIVLIIRGFIIQHFYVPSESLEPTVVPGDFLLVKQYSYGLRVPVWGTKVFPGGQPQRGDIVILHWPVNPKYDYVKRVIGLPGDTISYVNKVLTINGKQAAQTQGKPSSFQLPDGTAVLVQEKQEDLLGVKHAIYVRDEAPREDFRDLIVPKGHYFVMGDNRDDSDDSRYWGFVPERNLVGKAFMVWLSWNKQTSGFRWSRAGTWI